MRRRAFVRLRRLKVSAQYRKQRYKRQDNYDFAANAVDLLPSHGVTSFPSCIVKHVFQNGRRSGLYQGMTFSRAAAVLQDNGFSR